MALFTSPREKLLWICVVLVMAVIFATLFVANPLVDFFKNQNTQAVIFLCGMFLTGLAILINAIKLKPGSIELAVWIGIAAVSLMLFLRLGIPERSHLIEYSILAIFMYEALRERKRNGIHIRRPALLALILSFSIGILDEAIQYVLPNRVFDPIDILFNGMVITMAIGFTLFINWLRKHFTKGA